MDHIIRVHGLGTETEIEDIIEASIKGVIAEEVQEVIEEGTDMRSMNDIKVEIGLSHVPLLLCWFIYLFFFLCGFKIWECFS